MEVLPSSFTRVEAEVAVLLHRGKQAQHLFRSQLGAYSDSGVPEPDIWS